MASDDCHKVIQCLWMVRRESLPGKLQFFCFGVLVEAGFEVRALVVRAGATAILREEPLTKCSVGAKN